jgi:aspartyl-tRNA(Asn)/glutamyl-tRNA(Gln) amidotransferase subunit A
LKNLGIVEIKEKISNKEISSKEITRYYLDQIEKKKDLNVYITINDNCIKEAEDYDNGKREVKKLGGVPICIKDVFSTKDFRTTCASKILDNYVPQIDSTVTKKVFEEGSINLGKVNLDQFCHGSSTATSVYGPTRNPWDENRLPGGSSGGSAAAVIADLCAGALGTETAGSLRQPASWCGVVGMKPTYGRVSRFGVLAMGSSLDSPGVLTKNVEDAAYMLSIIAGYDKNDFTSSKNEVPNYYENLNPQKVRGLKIGVPKQYIGIDLEEGVRKNFEDSLRIFKNLGAKIVEVDLIDPKYSIAVYTLVCRSEVSSNLSRYDSTRYGIPSSEQTSFMKYIEEARGKGFGEETKRRIMTGTFSLSAGYADEYYRKAESIRQLLKEDLLKVLKDVDVIAAPTSPTTALKDNEVDNPIFGELADVLVEASSLSGLPGISIPNGLSNGLPTGLQIFTRHFEEQLILDVTKGFEEEFGTLTLKNT